MSAAASTRSGIYWEQFASHAETAKMITRSGRAFEPCGISFVMRSASHSTGGRHQTLGGGSTN